MHEEVKERLGLAATVVGPFDPFWKRVSAEASAMINSEPAMATIGRRCILNHTTLDSAIIYNLAARLFDTGQDALSGQALLRDAFSADREQLSLAFRADLVAVYDRDPACHRFLEPLLYFKGFHALQLHRLANVMWRHGQRDQALYIQALVSAKLQIDIHPAVRLGRGIMLDHGTGIVIGETAEVDDDVSIMQHVTLGGTGKNSGDRHPKIRRCVLLGANATVLGNFEIGACSRVAAGSVVLKAVPPNKTVAGVPARIIGDAGCLEPSTTMNQLFESAFKVTSEPESSNEGS